MKIRYNSVGLLCMANPSFMREAEVRDMALMLEGELL